MSGVGILEHVVDFVWMEHDEYCVKYHQREDASTCGGNETLKCGGRDPEEAALTEFEKHSPLSNLFNDLGATPFVGAVSGLARWAFSVVEFGVGVLGILLATVAIIVDKFFMIGFFNKQRMGMAHAPFFLLERGANDFWTGCLETHTLGFHKIIHDFVEHWGVKEAVQGLVAKCFSCFKKEDASAMTQ